MENLNKWTLEPHLHCVADALNMRGGVRRLRSKNSRHSGLHQMADALRCMKTVLRHYPLDFSVKLRTRQDLIVSINLVHGVAKRDFLWVRCLMIIVVGQRWEQAACGRTRKIKSFDENLWWFTAVGILTPRNVQAARNFIQLNKARREFTIPRIRRYRLGER